MENENSVNSSARYKHTDEFATSYHPTLIKQQTKDSTTTYEISADMSYSLVWMSLWLAIGLGAFGWASFLSITAIAAAWSGRKR